MSSPLLDAVAPARVIFVVGKGGVGKTTAAAALALECADNGADTHLISTDPAHSIGDLFAQPLHSAPVASKCNERLLLEEFDASAYGAQWLARALGPVGEIVEGGTYLDADDVAGFSRLALPGVDEMMAVLRLTDIARAHTHTLVIDTAPTGHTLRLLDAAATHEGIAHALRAMADKAAAVAGSLLKSTVRLRGERIIDELESYVSDFRTRVLDAAAFVIATRDGDVVAAETARLARSLADRKLRVAATVAVDATPTTHAGSCFVVPRISTTEPCALLREWRSALRPCADAQPRTRTAAAAISGEAALPWLRAHTPRLVFVAGKGGVGKSTCAGATALTLAEDRNVLLCSTDPAGSLDDVFGANVTQSETAAPQLRVLQIRADEALDRLRATYRSDVVDALEQLGIGDSAALDRRVIDALWSLTPPGLDELLAVIALLDTADADETVVVDSAPTGHFLRLLQMPGTALDWSHQLMRVIVKYGIAGTAGGAAETLLRIARELRALEERLHDPAAAGVFVVTLPEPLVRAETERLTRTLGEQGMHVVATFENRSTGSTAARGDAPMIRCPDWQPSPRGVAALREWSAAWKIVP